MPLSVLVLAVAVTVLGTVLLLAMLTRRERARTRGEDAEYDGEHPRVPDHLPYYHPSEKP